MMTPCRISANSGFSGSPFHVFFFQYKLRYLVVIKKRIHYEYEDGREKSVPREHGLSSLGKPRMPISDTQDGFFYPILTLMMDSYMNIYSRRNKQRRFSGQNY